MKSGHPRRNNVLSIFKMVTAAAQYCFWFRIGWRRAPEKAKVYRQTKFRWNNSIHGRDTTTSGLEELTSAVFYFYFQFRFRPYLHNRHVILHQRVKFHRNRSTYQFFAKMEWNQVRPPEMRAYSPVNLRGLWVLGTV